MKTTLLEKLKTKALLLINPTNWVKFFTHIIRSTPLYAKTTFSFITFFIVLVHFSTLQVYTFFSSIPLLGKPVRMFGAFCGKFLNRPTNALIQRLESKRPFQVRQSYLVYLAFENLKIRKSRTTITTFGMATGVGIIVFLLSLGYGIERLVISQVASLDELRIIDVSAGTNSALGINNTTINKIEKNQTAEKVIPLISLVGKVNFKKAVSDVLVYGATDDYFKVTGTRFLKGEGFSEKSKHAELIEDEENVLGAQTTIQNGIYGKRVDNETVVFNILPQQKAAVYSTCEVTSDILGYTTRIEGDYNGNQMWGSTYAPYDQYGKEGYDNEREEYLGLWMYAKVPLFNGTLEDELTPQISENGHQAWEYGCIQRRTIQIVGKVQQLGSVLGEATGSAELQQSSPSASLDASSLLAAEGAIATGSAQAAYEAEVISTDSAGIEFVRLTTSSESATIKKSPEFLEFTGGPSGEAIISTGFMKLLGLELDKAIGAEFDISLMIVRALRPDIEGRRLSQEVPYKIVGIVDNENEQYIHIPFADLQKLGVKNYSQLKVVMKDKKDVPKMRTEIETLGYTTSSSGDTVSQIESLFRNLRLVLASIGMIALAVASLGMFNTLTVSLLERTREIGGMKVIGMVSHEIQELFLAEAMIMGFAGGIGGIMLGFTLGQLTSFVISIFSVANGLGYLQVSYIPIPFVIFILFISFIVGILTGLYPARRAKNISALNALRYE